METIIYVIIVFVLFLGLQVVKGNAGVGCEVSCRECRCHQYCLGIAFVDISGEDKLALFFLGSVILFTWWQLEKKGTKGNTAIVTSQEREDGP